MSEIFIPYNVPSSKNSKQWTGKYLVNSKTVQKYIKDTKGYWSYYRNDFSKLLIGKEKPYKISLKFIRGSRRKFDYINPCQTIHDLMVKNNWLEDDNCNEILPIFEVYEYDKEKPGVIINVL